MIGNAATLISTPSPSPLHVHVITDNAAPVWLVPAMTGGFVLLAALITGGIAFLSLRASDKRKLRREDSRQWDSELKSIYVAISTQMTKLNIELARARSEPDSVKKLLDVSSETLVVISGHQTVLQLVAEQPVIAAVGALSQDVSEVYQKALLAQPQDTPDMRWAADHFMQLIDPMRELRDCMRDSLRPDRLPRRARRERGRDTRRVSAQFAAQEERRRRP